MQCSLVQQGTVLPRSLQHSAPPSPQAITVGLTLMWSQTTPTQLVRGEPCRGLPCLLDLRHDAVESELILRVRFQAQVVRLK